jgi:hypothetical protein
MVWAVRTPFSYSTPYVDPFDPFDILRFNFDGVDGAAGFVDSSPAGLLPYSGGVAAHNASQKVAGATSVRITTTSNVIVNHVGPLSLRGGPFSIELWVRMVGYIGTSYSDLVGKTGSGAVPPEWGIYVSSTGGVLFETYSAASWGAGICSLSVGSAPLNTWTHVAVSFDGSTYRTFNNGVLVSSFASATQMYSSTDALRFGTRNPGTSTFNLNAFIDLARITKGACRYTGNFIPNTATLPVG